MKVQSAAHLQADHHMHGLQRFVRCQGLAHDSRLIGLSHPGDAFDRLRKNDPFGWFFAAQLNHRERYGEEQQCCAVSIYGPSQ
jgi:hypothetical protein